MQAVDARSASDASGVFCGLHGAAVHTNALCGVGQMRGIGKKGMTQKCVADFKDFFVLGRAKYNLSFLVFVRDGDD